MIIKVYQKNVYGMLRIYPANEAAEILAGIAGTITLSQDNLRDAVKLGHEIQEVNPFSLLEEYHNNAGKQREYQTNATD